MRKKSPSILLAGLQNVPVIILWGVGFVGLILGTTMLAVVYTKILESGLRFDRVIEWKTIVRGLVIAASLAFIVWSFKGTKQQRRSRPRKVRYVAQQRARQNYSAPSVRPPKKPRLQSTVKAMKSAGAFVGQKRLRKLIWTIGALLLLHIVLLVCFPGAFLYLVSKPLYWGLIIIALIIGFFWKKLPWIIVAIAVLIIAARIILGVVENNQKLHPRMPQVNGGVCIFPLPDPLPSDFRCRVTLSSGKLSEKITIPYNYGIELTAVEAIPGACINVYTQRDMPFTVCKPVQKNGCNWTEIRQPQYVELYAPSREIWEIRLYDSRVANSRRAC